VNVPLQALSPDADLSDGVDYVWHSNSVVHTPDTLQLQPQRGSIVEVRWARRRCLGVVLNILTTPRYDPTKILPAVLIILYLKPC
jgi:hypothetical protein